MEPFENGHQLFDTADNRLGFMRESLAKGSKLPLYFKLRLALKGPFVGAKVGRFCTCGPGSAERFDEHEWDEKVCDRYPHLSAEINGEKYPLERLLKGGQVKLIDENEFRYLRDSAAWDKQYDPNSPLAQPGKKIDFKNLKIPF